ncbi:MAG TPA: hypothetical protein VF577_02555 [Allosphingosinicella sp.]|jgi:hypothetical protein
MLSLLIALSLLQASAGAASPPGPAAAEAPAGWNLASSEQGCIVHTTERAGIMLSVFALPEQDGIGFLLQNRKWSDLSDGRVYPLGIRFDDGVEWPVPALARTEIDEDGPGLFFAIRPGTEKGGRDFLGEFAASRGMRVANGGVGVGNLRLPNARGATVALADCLRGVFEGSSNPFGNSEGAGTSTRI